MSYLYGEQSTQTHDSQNLVEKQIQNSASVYSKRQDVIAIKSRLFELVPDEEYWDTLSQFIFGVCTKDRFHEVMDFYLITAESRNLHNDLIRAILFNAHFSVTPPPGLPIRMKPTSSKVAKEYHPRLIYERVPSRRPKQWTLPELGLVPSVLQLSDRVSFILKRENLEKHRIDDATANMIHRELLEFVVGLLKTAAKLPPRDYMKPNDIVVLHEHVVHAIRIDSVAMKLISPRLLAKLQISATSDSCNNDQQTNVE